MPVKQSRVQWLDRLLGVPRACARDRALRGYALPRSGPRLEARTRFAAPPIPHARTSVREDDAQDIVARGRVLYAS